MATHEQIQTWDSEQVREQYPAIRYLRLPRSECRLIKNRWICLHKIQPRAFTYSLNQACKSVPGCLRQTAIEYLHIDFPCRVHGA